MKSLHIQGTTLGLLITLSLVGLSSGTISCQSPRGPGQLISIRPFAKDLAYAAQSPAQKLDVYLPETGEGPFPVIVSIHGGAFLGGDKADGQLIPMLKGLERGYAVVSVNYRLSGEAKFPAQIQDVKAAIRWLRAHAQEYKLDSARIAVWGGSAGGHLSAMAGTSGGVAALEDLSQGNPGVSSRVQAVVDWFGPIDFLQMDPQFVESGKGRPDHSEASSPESKLLGAQITSIPEKVKEASPATYISSDDPPIFIQHGTIDRLIPTAQSILFAGQLTEVLGAEKVTLSLLEGADHGGPQFDAASNVKIVLDFLDAHLK
ncbi:MAG: alpha/beta hydrolase [Bacteroidetes bacterium]|nr:MAG: alpha/beta hydrolase [Bacteroidota bacterium]